MDAKHIRLTKEQKRRLAEVAKKRGKSWHEIVDEFLSSASIEQRDESVFDAAIRLGVARSVVGGPKDLASNPIHMEGFGENKG